MSLELVTTHKSQAAPDIPCCWIYFSNYLHISDSENNYFPSSTWASPVAQLLKNLPANAGDARDVGSIPRLGRDPGEGNGNLPQYPAGKESACNVGDLGSIPGQGRSPGEGNPLQYSGLENSMDCIVHRVAQNQTRLSDFHFTSLHFSTLAWRIPWMEEPGGLQSMESQRDGHDWACTHTNTHTVITSFIRSGSNCTLISLLVKPSNQGLKLCPLNIRQLYWLEIVESFNSHNWTTRLQHQE